jgi:acyl-CoA thioesterase
MMADAVVNDRIKHVIKNDRLIALFDMRVEEASEKGARVSAAVKDEFLQALGLAHGAFIFALLDVAFALTVNAKKDVVAAQWSVSQFRSAAAGERLTAECRLLHEGRRLMVVEFEVHDSQGRVIAKGQATGVPVGEEGIGARQSPA